MLVAPMPADGSRYSLRRDAGVIHLERDNVVIWTLDPALLHATNIVGPFPAGTDAIDLTDPVKVTISGAWQPSAANPGSADRMKFDLELAFKKFGSWHVSANWHFKSLGLSLHGDPMPLQKIGSGRMCATIEGAHLKKLLKEATGGAVHGPDRVALCLDHRFEVSLDAAPNHFSVLDGKMSLQRLVLSRAADDAIVSAASDAKAHDFTIGAHKATKLTLSTTGHLKVGIHCKNAIAQLRLVGSMSLGVLNGGPSTARIPCEAASVVASGTDLRWSFIASRDFFRLTTPYASFDVEVAHEGETRRPIEVVARKNAAPPYAGLVRFDAVLSVHSSTIAVPEADRSRFDFGGQHLRMVLERSHQDPAKEVMWTEGYALSDPHAPVVLNLNLASLRLWRGRDLFQLTYHFRDTDLYLGENPRIIGRPWFDRGKRPPKPTLIAEFPPQHIMERTFLRQNFELPDAGRPVAPADLRQLQRLSLTEGKELRAKIQMTKRSEESKELLGFDCTIPAPAPPPAAGAPAANPAPAPAPVPPAPFDSREACRLASQDTTLPFAEFANDWDSNEAKAASGETLRELYGQWIGPDGLFTLEARREARRFAVRRRGKERDRLIGTTGAFTPKDRAVVAEMLALTAFPLSRGEAQKYIKDFVRDGETAETKRNRLFEYAASRDENFKDIQDIARKALQTPTDGFLLTPNWPLSKEDWLAIFGSAQPDFPRADDDLRAMLKWQKASESDTLRESQKREDVPEGFKRPVEAWISEPSRLAFRIGTTPIPLDVEGLTSWDQFELRVTQRAKRLYSDIKASPHEREKLESRPDLILQAQGIDRSETAVSASHRMDVIRGTLVAPTDLETALEIPSRLILSPAQDARWSTPRRLPSSVNIWNPPEGAPVPVWQACLVERLKAPSLRAVWSPDFVAGVFDANASNRKPAPERWTAPDGKEYRTALSPFDRAELVALSSIYGLPVIASEDKERSSQIATPKDYEVKVDQPQQVGLFMPVALRTRRLALGATGAMMDLDTTFPAVTAARIDGKTLFDSFSIQRWRSLIVDASDVVTTVVRRGYLLPLGHKASLIKVTEPKLRPIDPLHPSAGYTVEQATRIFIEVTRATQTYPAVGQRNAARDLQPREVKLLTLRTPDLIDATDDRPLPLPEEGKRAEAAAMIPKAGPHGAVRGWINRADPGKPPELARLAGKVLWPRTDIGPRGTVRFRMKIDGGSAPVSMPLLFVDHTAASDPETIRLCGVYYNFGQDGKGDVSDKPKDWSKVLHNGAVRNYADEQKQGQCSFATDWQRFELAEGTTNFKIDAALLAAEQPPLYPRTARAQIRPQQIQGLTGSAAPELVVAYACDYVEKGFEVDSNSNNPAQDTYLVVPDEPRPKLDMGDHGDQGGTVARKAIEICGLNRRFGLAGPPVVKFDCAPTLAPVSPVVVPPPRAAAPLPSAPPAPPPAPTPAPPSGGNPPPPPEGPVCAAPTAPNNASFAKNFAIGHFGEDCKLFGLIKLSTFIELITGSIGANIVPQLEEITSFSGAALADFVGKISGPLKDLRKTLADTSGDLLFPGFAAALNELQCALPGVNVGNSLDEQIAAATQIWSAGQRVVRELEAIARTPLSDIAGRLKGLLSLPQIELGKSIDDTWRSLGGKLKDEITKALTSLADVLVTVTLEDEAQARRIRDAVALLLANKDVLASPDPLAEIVKRIKADPTLQDIADRELALVKGAMYERLEPLFEVLREYLTAGSNAAFAAAVKVIERAIALQGKLKDLLNGADAYCQKAFDALKTFIEAAFPDLNAGIIFDSVRDATLKQLRGSASELRTVATQLQAAGADAVLVNYIVQWAQAFDDGASRLQLAFDETARVRQAVISAIGTGASCGDFTFAIARRFAVLEAARQRLFAAWQQAVAPPPPPQPLPSIPGNVAALWQKAAAQITATVKGQLQAAIDATLAKVVSAGSSEWTRAEQALKEASDAVPADLREDFALALDNVKAGTDKARNDLLTALQLPATTDLAAIANWARTANSSFSIADAAIRTIETTILNAVLRLAMASIMKFAPDLNQLALAILEPAIVAYEAVKAVRKKFYDNLKPRPSLIKLLGDLFGQPPVDECQDDWVDAVLLVKPDGSGVCKIDDDLLIHELEILRGRRLEDLITVLKRWGDKKSAPQLIGDHVEHFTKLAVHANILKVFDVEQLRRDLLDALSSVLPTTRTLTSKLDLPLSETSVGLGTFRPTEDEDPTRNKKLILDTKATINLLNLGATPQVEFKGTVGAFELDILSIMTFSFRKGVTYTKSASDGRGSISAPLGAEDVKFGDKLSFLADLASALSFGSDSGEDGPYTIVHIDNPSIEAGYRISIPVITLGVTFTNIHFAGAVVLPFNSRSARIRAALSSLDAPFMISVGIYGGSGFMGIEASPHGIEAFEASFEFGGICSMGYGPLQGTAYVTTGAYVRKDQLGCTFAALFSAGFAAHIACFGISASFTLRLYKRAGSGSVEGEAQLTFTFSVGPAKVHYTIRVARTMQAGFGGGGQQASSLSGGVQVAALGGFTPDCFPIAQKASLTTISVNPADHWSDFEDQFDQKFRPGFAA